MNRVSSERCLIGITQADLAERLGVDKSTVVRWEAGGNIPVKKLAQMRLLFKCDLDWLLGLSEQRHTIN